MNMYKVIKEFSDLLKDLHKYKVGDAYEEISSTWTKYLVDKGNIEKVSFEKKKYEAVQKEQE